MLGSLTQRGSFESKVSLLCHKLAKAYISHSPLTRPGEAEDAAEAEAAREATAKLEDIEDAIRNRVATPLSGSSSAHVASSDEAMEVDTLATSPSAPTTRSIQLSDELVALRARALSARRQARNEVAEADKSEET